MQFYQNETKLSNVKTLFINPKLLTLKFKNNDQKIERVFNDYYDLMDFLYEKQKEGLVFESCQVLPYRKRCLIENELKAIERKQNEDNFKIFIKSYIQITGNQEDFIKCTQLYEIYNSVFPGLSQTLFTKKLKATQPDIIQKQKRLGEINPTSIFCGIKLKPDYHHQLKQ